MEEIYVTQADSRAHWPMLTKFNPAATNKTSQKAKRGPLVAAPSLGQKNRFGARIIKNHVFKPSGRQNRIPDVKKVNNH